jgi:hypothetical protein
MAAEDVKLNFVVTGAHRGTLEQARVLPVGTCVAQCDD